MIEIKDKTQCCSCEACRQSCPKECLTMVVDHEGFSYPEVNKDFCVDCGVCEKVCPMLNVYEKAQNQKIYAAINKDEKIRLESSSGGIFTLLAEDVIRKGGVVFGARFDEKWDVVLDYTETVEGLAAFRGSKYVQSYVGDTYKQAQEFLKQGRQVLFSGSPCQVAGLKHFLKKDYDNLLVVDFLCHGMPSPKVWHKYLEEIVSARIAANGKSTVLSSLDAMSDISDIRFRDKSDGWKKYRFVLKFAEPNGNGEQSSILSSIHRDNVYMKAFLSDLILRPSCYECKTRVGRSGSDITIGDFWGIQEIMPEMDDDKGTGVVMVNSSRGESVLETISVDCREVDVYEVKYNGGLRERTDAHRNREKFFYKLDVADNVSELIVKMLKPSLIHRIKGLVKRVVKRVLFMLG